MIRSVVRCPYPVVCAGGALALLSTVWLAQGKSVSAGDETPAKRVTFSKDIAPIVQRACQNCHRPGSIAPMSPAPWFTLVMTGPLPADTASFKVS